MVESNSSTNEDYFRVFAYGHGHGALISERFRRSAAEKCRQEWQKSMPDADVRIEKVKKAAAERWVDAVNADGTYGRWRYVIAKKTTEVTEKIAGVTAP